MDDGTWLERAAALRPARAAVEAPDGSLTYSELLARARATAPGGPGELVPIDPEPGLDFVVALHACLLTGAVAVPVDSRLGERERAAVARPAVEPHAGAVMVVHTSGTTGAPQPVVLTAGNVLANALGTAVALGLDPGERWLCPLPLSHVGGLMVLLRSAIYATTAVLAPPRVEPAALAGVTVASLVPTQLARLLDAGLERPPGLRTVLLGGAGAPRALRARAAAAQVPVAASYGLTQACSAVTIAEPGDLDSVGVPLPGLTVELAPDGEILVSGPSVAGGGGGPLATGDLGALDPAGRLRVVGRKAETIVTGGENVAPAEVEAVLVEHPAVADAGVLGVPDAEWGEAVVAQVVLREPVDPEALRAFARARLAGHKVPKAITVVDALPRTGSGKLERRALSSPA